MNVIPITSDQVHVWLVTLDVPRADCSRLEWHLSDYERQRASRFIYPRDRQRFVVARGSLREILARYLVTQPESIQFVCNSFGKPYLQGTSRIQFNLAHSESLAAIAVAIDREVGIDVEACKPELATREVAEQSFSPDELLRLRAVADGTDARHFFTFWTLKEAYIKAIGMGLSYDLVDFDVTPDPGQVNALLRDRRHPSAVHRWLLSSLPMPSPFAGALCYSGAPACIVRKGEDGVVPGYATGLPLPLI